MKATGAAGGFHFHQGLLIAKYHSASEKDENVAC